MFNDLGKYPGLIQSILSGWNNAPHHPQVNTFPHHHHAPEDVVPSQVRSMTDVLDLLASQLLPDDQ